MSHRISELRRAIRRIARIIYNEREHLMKVQKLLAAEKAKSEDLQRQVDNFPANHADLLLDSGDLVAIAERQKALNLDANSDPIPAAAAAVVEDQPADKPA